MRAVDTWLAALHARHVAPYRPKEFTHALRALSARYVERRGELADRSALDSAGKRAAFGAVYAPLHFFTVREIVRALAPAAPSDVLDLGCGTGVGAAAWADAVREAGGAVPPLTGVDENAWALGEAAWNWQQLGVSGRTQRGDMVAAAARAPKGPNGAPPAIVLAWAVNELPRDARTSLLPTLVAAATAGSHVLIVEPLARGVSPWWQEWVGAFNGLAVRTDDFKFRGVLPRAVTELAARADLRWDAIGARALFVSRP